MMSRLWILTLAVVLLHAQEPAQGSFNLGKERDAAMGAGFASGVRRRTSAIADAAVQDYIASLGSRLAAQNGRRRLGLGIRSDWRRAGREYA
jgi:predicted Zn-dependent protease